MRTVGAVLDLILFIFFLLLMVRLVVEWVQMFARSWRPKGPILVVLEVVYTITDPPILLIRRFVPPLRLGSIMLDTSFIIVLVIVWLLRQLVAVIFFR